MISLGGFVVALYAVLDVNYFLAVIWNFLRTKIKYGTSKEELISPKETFMYSGICLPHDLDYNMHMNNAKYLKAFEHARTESAVRTGFLPICAKTGHFPVLSAVVVRYRKSVLCFEKFDIKTTLLYVTGRDMYFEQELIGRDDKFIRATSIAKVSISPAIDPLELFPEHMRQTPGFREHFCHEPPEEIKFFMAYNDINSSRLNPAKSIMATPIKNKKEQQQQQQQTSNEEVADKTIKCDAKND